MSTFNSNFRLKLLIDTKSNRVLCAEASKDFVDFLFTLLAFPIGSIIRLLKKNGHGMVGSLGKLYKSVENLSDTYMQPQPKIKRNVLLKPKLPLGVAEPHLLSLQLPKKVYICFHCRGYVAEDPKLMCPQCNCAISTVVPCVASQTTTVESSSERGYVKDVVTYVLMDDLEVKPMSNISCMALIKKFNVNDFGALQEEVVSVTKDEVLELIKASLKSNKVLTNVFLGEN